MTAFLDTSIRGTTGIITLDRPKALNSLNDEMIHGIYSTLKGWERDDAVTQVVVRSSSRHFCSGGDVKLAREEILEGNREDVSAFFAEEYEMNHYIANYPKPYIALVSGVDMGGGMGISALGSHMVVQEGAFASMPEMNIGYVTDVGQSWKLQHLPQRPSLALGKFLGLTGYRLQADDMLDLGLASHKVATLEGLTERIVEEGLGVLDEVALPAGRNSLEQWFEQIEEVFVGSWAEIQARLDGAGAFGEEVKKLTSQASPSALVAAAELFEANAALGLKGALENERVLGELIRHEPDFAEGVRAVLVDKDQSPSFAPQPDPEKYRAVLR
ncbi:3-hydroxyisobutyryl-CoA hydrolase [Corynebacterium sp. p3-SID1056]|uniref:3-hydroxyisobutyryl-CoA hydrolase n=1 Tax=Corynebacterium sp. p3-SID1056 TaxID=2916092 RepID=UPI0021A7F3DA|nr:3-hydroxyisobutyryl-CoA hydrolase [Corynebacterium sp. p3-SID1056]MCT2339044.1 3-hydroxyisobutyryl-CoA hydrolase [Corynebacterium sp. p3-SID1056]